MYTTLAFLALLGALYIYDISSLRVKKGCVMEPVCWFYVRRQITAQLNNCGADTGTDFFAVNDTAQRLFLCEFAKTSLDITRVSSLSINFRLQHFLLRKMFVKLLPTLCAKGMATQLLPSLC